MDYQAVRKRKDKKAKRFSKKKTAVVPTEVQYRKVAAFQPSSDAGKPISGGTKVPKEVKDDQRMKRIVAELPTEPPVKYRPKKTPASSVPHDQKENKGYVVKREALVEGPVEILKNSDFDGYDTEDEVWYDVYRALRGVKPSSLEELKRFRVGLALEARPYSDDDIKAKHDERVMRVATPEVADTKGKARLEGFYLKVRSNEKLTGRNSAMIAEQLDYSHARAKHEQEQYVRQRKILEDEVKALKAEVKRVSDSGGSVKVLTEEIKARKEDISRFKRDYITGAMVPYKLTLPTEQYVQSSNFITSDMGIYDFGELGRFSMSSFIIAKQDPEVKKKFQEMFATKQTSPLKDFVLRDLPAIDRKVEKLIPSRVQYQALGVILKQFGIPILKKDVIQMPQLNGRFTKDGVEGGFPFHIRSRGETIDFGTGLSMYIDDKMEEVYYHNKIPTYFNSFSINEYDKVIVQAAVTLWSLAKYSLDTLSMGEELVDLFKGVYMNLKYAIENTFFGVKTLTSTYARLAAVFKVRDRAQTYPPRILWLAVNYANLAKAVGSKAGAAGEARVQRAWKRAREEVPVDSPGQRRYYADLCVFYPHVRRFPIELSINSPVALDFKYTVANGDGSSGRLPLPDGLYTLNPSAEAGPIFGPKRLRGQTGVYTSEILIANQVLSTVEKVDIKDEKQWGWFQKQFAWMWLFYKKKKKENKDITKEAARNIFPTSSPAFTPAGVAHRGSLKYNPTIMEHKHSRSLLGLPLGGGVVHSLLSYCINYHQFKSHRVHKSPLLTIVYADNIFLVTAVGTIIDWLPADGEKMEAVHTPRTIACQMKRMIYDSYMLGHEDYNLKMTLGYQKYLVDILPQIAADGVCVDGDGYQISLKSLGSGVNGTGYYNHERMSTVAFDIARLCHDIDQFEAKSGLIYELTRVNLDEGPRVSLDFTAEHGKVVDLDFLGFEVVKFKEMGLDTWFPKLQRKRLYNSSVYHKSGTDEVGNKALSHRENLLLRVEIYKALYLVGGALEPGLDKVLIQAISVTNSDIAKDNETETTVTTIKALKERLEEHISGWTGLSDDVLQHLLDNAFTGKVISFAEYVKIMGKQEGINIHVEGSAVPTYISKVTLLRYFTKTRDPHKFRIPRDFKRPLTLGSDGYVGGLGEIGIQRGRYKRVKPDGAFVPKGDIMFIFDNENILAPFAGIINWQFNLTRCWCTYEPLPDNPILMYTPDMDVDLLYAFGQLYASELEYDFERIETVPSDHLVLLDYLRRKGDASLTANVTGSMQPFRTLAERMERKEATLAKQVSSEINKFKKADRIERGQESETKDSGLLHNIREPRDAKMSEREEEELDERFKMMAAYRRKMRDDGEVGIPPPLPLHPPPPLPKSMPSAPEWPRTPMPTHVPFLGLEQVMVPTGGKILSEVKDSTLDDETEPKGRFLADPTVIHNDFDSQTWDESTEIIKNLGKYFKLGRLKDVVTQQEHQQGLVDMDKIQNIWVVFDEEDLERTTLVKKGKTEYLASFYVFALEKVWDKIRTMVGVPRYFYMPDDLKIHYVVNNRQGRKLLEGEYPDLVFTVRKIFEAKEQKQREREAKQKEEKKVKQLVKERASAERVRYTKGDKGIMIGQMDQPESLPQIEPEERLADDAWADTPVVVMQDTVAKKRSTKGD